MKTEVLMKRKLFGSEIGQRSKSEFFSATDLVRAGNRFRVGNGKTQFNMSLWLNSESTKEYIESIEEKYSCKAVIKGRGRSAQTWIHPLLFIDMALAISPQLKVEVYEWLFDNLIRFRNDSGDSYKKMCGALYEKHKNVRTFPDFIKDVANRIQKHCGVKYWQNATEEQLIARDKIHDLIAVLADVMNNNEEAVRIAIEKTEVKKLNR